MPRLRRPARQPRWHGPLFTALAVLLVAAPSVVAAQATTISAAEWQRVLAVEDSRTTDADSLRVLTDALHDRRAAMRGVAARAIGRFERPSLLPALYAVMADPSPGVRMEVADAIAQIVRPASQVAGDVWRPAVDTLMSALSREKDPGVLGVLAQSLGRVARGDSSAAPVLERLSSLLRDQDESGSPSPVRLRMDPRVVRGAMQGVYAASRSRRPAPDAARSRSNPGSADLRMLRYGLGSSGQSTLLAAQVRRLAMLTLISPGIRGDSIALLGMRDPDAQVRRLAVLATANVEDSTVRRRVLTASLRDAAFIVRFDAVRSWRRFYPADCGPLVAATKDVHPAALLAAIDALGGCTDHAAAAKALEPLAASTAPAARRASHVGWHAQAHALVALARVAPDRAAPLVRTSRAHTVWRVRMYAARAAAILKDTETLNTLSSDAVPDVQEAAIAGLASVSPRAADDVAMRALSSSAYQVVLAGATALKGTTPRPEVVSALFAALERLTGERRENSRDPRVAVLERIGELGDAAMTSRLEPYVRDFDPAVAEGAAQIVSRWSGRPVAAAPAIHRVISDRMGALFVATNVRLRVTMDAASGGGTFVIRLRSNAAPATVARLVELAEKGYYNGLTFHRVEPTFVIQGGSPLATEYVGDGPFMRDEVDLASHVYGTVGISTRGRDTGDAQIFVNLTDNFRLDHDYTVVGEVVEGMSVVDGILEGDTMARVTVVGLR
ncbi:MAG: peptidylprolyl isomerase [Gemmatimonadaceae bacterium]